MPRKVTNALTPLSVKNAKSGRHADGGGLYLLVKATGARSWVFRFMLNGKARDVGLGAAAGPDALSLAKARVEAAKLRLKVQSGIDPIEERDREEAEKLAAAQAALIAGTTFKEVAEAHIDANEESWRNPKHRQQWRTTMADYVYPKIGELSVADVDTPHVLSILEPIWREKPETASRVRGRIETILDAAKARGYRKGENPARWRGHLAQILPDVSKTKEARNRKLGRDGHHKALPYDDVPAFIAALRKREAVTAMALEFIILTAVRTSEALKATWDEIDFDKAVWTVPPDRMKASKEHRVPLSPRALELLKTAQGLGGKHLFPAPRAATLSDMSLLMLLKRMKVDVTTHGFRSSIRDWLAERTNFPHEVCEMTLSHTISNKVEAAYRRGDLFAKRRKLMEAWADFCNEPVKTGGNVSAIGQHKARKWSAN
ncbi:putative phage integrase [Novosphingobium resinovorum]|uniref:Putative phage integrase n=1 Tax=Novosphingobium resinovorum TaxID=158500 RepID=A0A031JNB3_9SPHN|nr:site-specific integrase [Novosphingobium resinovorum]EZP74920.1 putative phage integrase [Novosphingobium resinovorum]